MDLVRKVWVCFDKDDCILEVCEEERDPDCLAKDCGQFVMKLIPIHRDIGELEDRAKDFEKALNEMKEVDKEFDQSMRRLKKSMDRYRI